MTCDSKATDLVGTWCDDLIILSTVYSSPQITIQKVVNRMTEVNKFL